MLMAFGMTLIQFFHNNSISSPDSVKVNVYYAEKGKAQSQKLIKPYGTVLNMKRGKCASYKIESSSSSSMVTSVEIRSPIEVSVVFHSRDQSSAPMELSSQVIFARTHYITVEVEKSIDVNHDKKPCYDPKEHQGVSYEEYTLTLLSKMIDKNFNCTTPVIPKKYRIGTNICTNPSHGEKVHQFLSSYAPTYSGIMWNDQYDFLPPCVYHKYNIKDVRKGC